VDRFKWVIQLATLGLLIVAGYLVVQRGGLLAWSGVIAALLLLIKQRARPSRTDMFVVLGFTLLWTASWAAAWSYVRSTWESGEVVELSVPVSDEIQTARVWILDADGGPVMYYDAPPRIGEALLAGAPITLARGNERIEACADATPAADLPRDEMSALLGVMWAKYQERNRATDVFYVLLGVERDRIGLVVRIKECA